MGATILVVEDYPAIRTLLAFILTQRGHTVRLAPDGEAALTAITADRPDLVLTDAAMPFLNGVDLIRRLQVQHPDLPVVLMSGHDMARSALPDIPFVAKPFDLPQLQATLAQVLAARRHRTE